MTATAHKPDLAPVLFDHDYQKFIWQLMEKLEQRDITISDLQAEVRAYSARVSELERRVR